MITRAKTTPLPPGKLADTAARIRATWKPHLGDLVPPMLGVNNFEHWFAEPTWRQLAGLKQAVTAESAEGAELNFFLVIFSSILRAVSNADDQSQKTYVSGTRPKKIPDVSTTWDNAVRRAIEGMEAYSMTSATRALVEVPENGNALEIPYESGSFDLAITSPPYLDSVDYPYNLMLEHFWLANELKLPDRQAFNQLRHSQVGAKSPEYSAVQAALSSDFTLDHIPPYRQASVLSYFGMMDRHFSEMARVIRDGGRYVFVVGNSGTSAGPLPIHQALVHLAKSHRFGLEHSFGYRLRRHYMKFPRAGRGGIILVDWVLTLRRGLSTSIELPDLVDAHVDFDTSGVAH